MFVAAIAFGILAWRSLAHPVFLIEWSTSSELDTAGYNLYRIDSDQFRTKLNEYLIPASPDPLIGGDYKFEDKQVQAGQFYTYELEEVENGGKRNSYGTIEVQAERGGVLEGVLFLIFVLFFIVGMAIFVKRGRGDGAWCISNG